MKIPTSGTAPESLPGLPNGASNGHPNGDAHSLSLSHAPDAALSHALGATPSEYEEAGEINGFARVMRALARRWPYALILSSLILAAGTYIALTALPLYRATATIEDISSVSGSSSGSSGMPDISQLMGGTQNASIQTQVAKLTSPWVEEGARKRLSPAVKAKVEKGSLTDTDAAPQPGTNLIVVSASAHHADVAAEMANRICEEYIAQSLQRNRDTMKGSVSYVKARLDDVQKQLSRAQNDLADYKQRNNTMDLATETQQIVLRLAEAQTSLQTIQTERAASAVQRQKLKDLLAKTPESKMVPSGIVPSPEV